MRFDQDDVDLIAPSQIEHHVDEIWGGKGDDKLEQYYNYIDYHFERDGAYLRGRTYVDDIRVVTLYGPFEKRGSIRKVVAPAAEAAVLAYLSRRFRQVKRL